jgi:mRNA interferase RelE/StbE
MSGGPYRIEVTPRARRDIRALRGAVRQRIVDAIDGLKDEPRPHGVEKIRGMPDAWRLRVGSLRICYQVFDREVRVSIVRIGDRKEIYRLLQRALRSRG